MKNSSPRGISQVDWRTAVDQDIEVIRGEPEGAKLVFRRASSPSPHVLIYEKRHSRYDHQAYAAVPLFYPSAGAAPEIRPLPNKATMRQFRNTQSHRDELMPVLPNLNLFRIIHQGKKTAGNGRKAHA
jgi:hypothetical protein